MIACSISKDNCELLEKTKNIVSARPSRNWTPLHETSYPGDLRQFKLSTLSDAIFLQAYLQTVTIMMETCMLLNFAHPR